MVPGDILAADGHGAARGERAVGEDCREAAALAVAATTLVAAAAAAVNNIERDEIACWRRVTTNA
jgi:hypothetical protein